MLLFNLGIKHLCNRHHLGGEQTYVQTSYCLLIYRFARWLFIT